MKKILAAIAVVIGLTGMVAAHEGSLSSPEAAQYLLPSVGQLTTRVDGGNALCTVTKIGNKRWLTARHCVSSLSTNYKVFLKGQGSANVLGIFAMTNDKSSNNPRSHSDIAVLFTDEELKEVPAINLACQENVYLGQPVAYLGFGAPLKPGFFVGHVVSTEGPTKQSRRSNFDFASSQHVSGGASGSALISMDTGNILGVVSEFVPADRVIVHALGAQSIKPLCEVVYDE